MFVWRTFPGRADARPGSFLALPDLERAGIRAAFTNRTGGHSDGEFASLDLSFFSGDDADVVRKNRTRALAAVGVEPDAWTSARQVHAARVECVDENTRGRGAFSADTTIAETDGLWTETAGVALAVLTADCLPVLVADTGRRRIAVLHAGWRGLVAGILEAGARALIGAGSDAAELRAYIGPAIGPCCYEVGDDVAAAARDALGSDVVVKGERRAHMDLWTGARVSLARAGVTDAAVAALCTRCEPHRFYSHRAGASARQGLVAVIE